MNPSISTINTANIPIDNLSEIVIVGAGPVGLWTAIQANLLGKKVTVIDKSAEYKRDDIHLRIQASSLRGIPNDPILKEMTRKWTKRKTVPIMEIHQDLLKRANDLGIQIIIEGVKILKTLPELFPKASLFIGADGAHSQVRSEIFGDRFSFHSNLQYLVRVRYLVEAPPEPENEGSIQSMKVAAESYRIQKFAERIIKHTRRPLKEGLTQVTLDIFMDQATYEGMSDAKSKNPWGITEDLNKVPPGLRDVLIKWWGARKVLYKEEISPEDPKENKMTVIALNQYAVENPVLEKDGKIWALVGDAAQVYPYFRAINNGFLLGTKLAKSLSSKEDLKSYSRYAKFRSFVERSRAFIKNLFIKIFYFWLQISNKTPWQSIKWIGGERNEIRTEGTKIWNRLSGANLQPHLEPGLVEKIGAKLSAISEKAS